MEKNMHGFHGKTLRINLTDHSVKVEERDAIFYRRYLGGEGFVAYTLLNELPRGVDPLGPETIQISRDDSGRNEFDGRVLSHVYMGTYARYKVAVGDYELEVVTDPEGARVYHDGDPVRLRFPPEKIWVLPRVKN